MRALRALKRAAESPFVFVSERGAPFTVSGLQKLVERAGIAAKIGFKAHPHMLRHATGFVLANRGTDTRKRISGTAAFNRLCVILSWHQTASRTLGAPRPFNAPISSPSCASTLRPAAHCGSPASNGDTAARPQRAELH